jgi:lipopolysaccharide biosynthesis glycosyltransferase
MYWFCGVNDNSSMHKDMYITSLKSAVKNTTLTPILLYDGTDDIFRHTVETYNGRIINHRTLLFDKHNFKNKQDGWKNIACGAFLRIDIPIICKQLSIEDNTVLYTDTDVIFLQDVVSELNTYNPFYFAICPEFDKKDYTSFNSGVMLINVRSMYDTYTNLTTFMEEKKYDFPAFDQGALQIFYKNKIDRLPLYFNHKPYWGIDNAAKIIHYHGPKYNNIMEFILNGNVILAYKDIFNMVHNDIWKYYLILYESYVTGFDWKYYLDTYPDLRTNVVHTEQQAIQHFNTFGRKEGRVAIKIPQDFDWTYYLDTYPDLRANGINTEQQAKQHFCLFGRLENRIYKNMTI